jgi:hypothetical protein
VLVLGNKIDCSGWFFRPTGYSEVEWGRPDLGSGKQDHSVHLIFHMLTA